MTHHSHDERVRVRAYEIWLNEGKPEGREQRHWEMAREIVGYEDAHRSTLQPVSGSGESAEPALSFQSQGDLPTLTDQGELEAWTVEVGTDGDGGSTQEGRAEALHESRRASGRKRQGKSQAYERDPAASHLTAHRGRSAAPRVMVVTRP